jgi:lysozyme
MMTPEMLSKLKRSLVKHEGLENFPYVDTAGKITIGIGYNLTDRGLSDEWINDQYMQDVCYFYQQLSGFEWFPQLTIDRQIVLIDMCFMGWKKFLTFKKMINAISIGDFKKAAIEMLDSAWANQVKGRAVSLSHAMETGTYDV